ncbi:glycosyltransferase family 2 protein [Ammoniphilus sp. CFH 90114]|uniref:glycosyltransferase family 2 protein n=1 Tax=Ammoniphilus sp. CFH 90114 TaxID=2493665 RepID=UPI00100E7107|nr:glycosyltransferase family 2 protein [Ammoniphilus sp. CFH 90114]RXT13807.1 glycosyltransferase family 2 protein [Ammoniphilus sp. CFH 90114]
MSISAIIPAYNEERLLPETIKSLRQVEEISEIVVVDDGSTDSTNHCAQQLADRVISLAGNCGKGEALRQGYLASHGEVVLFLDSDLGHTAVLARYLLRPVLRGSADMTIAVFPPPLKKSGFGLVKGLARQGIHKLTGFHSLSPLSGQRALTREAADSIEHWDVRFGIEVGMTIDVLRSGYSVLEIPIPFSHRETGRDLAGFFHRGRQMIDVGRMLRKKWLAP